MEPNLKEIIKNKIDLTRYIAKYSPVDSRGFASCPIHKETQASLKIYDNKSWYCFGCLKGGDVFDFAMALDNLDFKTALIKLAYYAGVDIFSYKPTESRFNKVNEVLKLNAEIKKWELILTLTQEQILLACDIMNTEYQALTHTPIEAVDHSTYTKIHINQQRFEEYNEQADKVLDMIKAKLKDYQEQLNTVKRGK
jgi:hypothetical protein